MAMPAIRRRWTAADVRELTVEDRPWPRYELIDDELLVTPAPSNRHQIAVGDLLIVLPSDAPLTGMPWEWPDVKALVLAVEILSPGDRRRAVLAKVEEWLTAGVSLLWVIDPKRVTAKVFRADGSVSLVSSTGELDGEDVVPGFRCALADVFT